MSVTEVSVDFGGRPLTLQTGKLAKQTDASVLCQYGETVVLVTVVASRKVKEGQDFFPLTCDFQEKYYAAGRFPGGFFKREAKPSDRATLSARLIDRPIRPLFPEDFLCETNVVATVLSYDGVNEPDILASIGASAALHISDIPFNGPVGTVRVACINGEFKTNVPPTEMEESSCDLLVSGVRTGVIMVEGSAKEVSEKEMMDAIDYAHAEMQKIFELQDELKQKVGAKEKREYPKPTRDEALKTQMRKASWPGFEKAFAVREKLARYEALGAVKEALEKQFVVDPPKTDADKAKNDLVDLYFEELKSTYARELTLNSKRRIDGREYDAIRPITGEVGLLPRVHGSGLFTRGETQVLAAVTLGTSDDEQKIDSISGVYQKTFLLHYNFPPFSVGEARPLRPPGRREIGHGFLAERALSYVIPSKEDFPYTIRLVSEVLESNGSSSMATVCSGSMALMDAGIPIPKPVAGVAMGLITDGKKHAVLSDILGDEDHLGDMDFKVCGTAEGITAFQMDLKIGGVSREIMEAALAQAQAGRLHILGKMAEVIAKPREQFSQYAPRIITIKVKPDKVREVIGSGGKVIRSIIERTGVKIDIEDDGSIHIASTDDESAQKAIDIINQIVEEAEPGKVYEGRVSRIAEFGAFIEIIPGTDGLCHISELDHHRVRRVEDVLKEGDLVKVKCLEVDSQGKIRLSRKALLPRPGSDTPPPTEGPAPSSEDGDEAPRTARAERPERGEGRPERGEGREPRESRPERGDRPEREGREGRGEGRGRFSRGEGREHREGRPERGDRPEREGRGEGREGAGEGRARFSRGEGRGERPSRPERGDRDSSERSDRGDRDERPSRGDREGREGGRDGWRDSRPRPSVGRDRYEARSDRDRGGDRGDRGERSDRDRPIERERGDRQPRDFDRDRGPRGDRGGRPGRAGAERGNERDRGNDRGNDRGPDRGNDRGNDRGGDPETRGNRRHMDDNRGNERHPMGGGGRDRGGERGGRGGRTGGRGGRGGARRGPAVERESKFGPGARGERDDVPYRDRFDRDEGPLFSDDED